MADFKENPFRVGRRESAEYGNNCRRRKGRYRKEPWENAETGEKSFLDKIDGIERRISEK